MDYAELYLWDIPVVWSKPESGDRELISLRDRTPRIAAEGCDIEALIHSEMGRQMVLQFEDYIRYGDEVDGAPRLTHGVVVRHLMLPGALEDSKRVVRTMWERYGASVLLSLMNQYTPALADAAATGDAWAQGQLKRCPELAKRVPDSEYEELLDYADSLGIEDYFWQQGGAAKESFIPAFDLTGVQ